MATFVEGRVVGFGLNSEAPQKSIPWYKEDLGKIPGPARELLQHHGSITPVEVISHVYRIVSGDTTPIVCDVLLSPIRGISFGILTPILALEAIHFSNLVSAGRFPNARLSSASSKERSYWIWDAASARIFESLSLTARQPKTSVALNYTLA